MSRFTLYGCYQYDPSLFDDITLPDGIEKDNLVNLIMQTSGDLYPYHQVPSQLKLNISFWFKRMFYNFQQAQKAITAEYEPIENYNRMEDSTHTLDSTATSKSTNEAHSSGNVSGNSSADMSRSAYNSDEYEPVSHETSSSYSGNSVDNSGQSDNSSTGSNVSTDRVHVHGNIGTTTSATMVSEELRLRHYDLLKDIALQFEHEFLIQVY